MCHTEFAEGLKLNKFSIHSCAHFHYCITLTKTPKIVISSVIIHPPQKKNVPYCIIWSFVFYSMSSVLNSLKSFGLKKKYAGMRTRRLF